MKELNSSKDSIIAARTKQVEELTALEAKLTDKVASLETSLTKAEEQLKLSQSNTGLTEQQRALFETRLNEYKAELAETRKDLERANASKKWWALGGVGAGFLLGKAKF